MLQSSVNNAWIGRAMQEIIVLGEIPGTSTQLNFTQWAIMSICILLTMLLLFSVGDISKFVKKHVDKAKLEEAVKFLTI